MELNDHLHQLNAPVFCYDEVALRLVQEVGLARYHVLLDETIMMLPDLQRQQHGKVVVQELLLSIVSQPLELLVEQNHF